MGILLSYFCPAFFPCPPDLHQALGQLLAPVHLTVVQDKESLHVIQPCDALVMVTVVRLRELHTQVRPQRVGEQAWWNGAAFFQMVGEAETRIWIHSIRLTIFTLTPVLALTLLVSASH